MVSKRKKHFLKSIFLITIILCLYSVSFAKGTVSNTVINIEAGFKSDNIMPVNAAPFLLNVGPVYGLAWTDMYYSKPVEGTGQIGLVSPGSDTNLTYMFVNKGNTADTVYIRVHNFQYTGFADNWEVSIWNEDITEKLGDTTAIIRNIQPDSIVTFKLKIYVSSVSRGDATGGCTVSIGTMSEPTGIYTGVNNNIYGGSAVITDYDDNQTSWFKVIGPAQLQVIGDNKYICNVNMTLSDSIGILVLDNYNQPLRNVQLNYEIIEKPPGSEGEKINYAVTDEEGKSYFNFKTGNKSGAYIVKVSYENIAPVYIGFFTDEKIISAKEWHLISANKIPAKPDFENAFVDFIPNYIYKWNPLIEEHPVNQKFQEVENIRSGEGYFIVTPNQTTLKLNGNYLKDNYAVNLEAGWNLIGNPYYYSIDWMSGRIIYEDNRSVSLSQAVADSYIINTIYWYKDNAYMWGPNESIPEPKLPNWSGFWIKVLRKCKLQLSNEFLYAETDRINFAPKKNICHNNWTINVSVTGNNTSDLINYFGVKENASDYLDNYDVRKAPAMPGMLDLSFVGTVNLTADIKAPFEKYKDWNFRVNSGSNTNLKLEFNNIYNLPDRYEIFLKDEETKRIINLRHNNIYEYNTGENSQRYFRILVSVPEYQQIIDDEPFSKEKIFVSPNPGPDNNNRIRFVYSPLINYVRIKVFDMGGNPVIDRKIDASLAGNSGGWEWDLMNDSGRRISRGVYIYKIEVRMTDGRNRTVVDKFAVLW